MSATTTGSATLRDLIAFYRLNGRMPFQIQGGEGDPPNPDPKDPKDDFPEGVGDAGKEAIRKERDARKEADRKANDAAKELAQLRKEKADRDKAEAEKADADAIESGKFKELAEKRAKEAEDAKSDAQTKTARLTRAEAALATLLVDQVKALEDLKDADLSAEFAAIADPLDQLEWLSRPSVKRAMGNATEAKKVADANGQPRIPRTPRPNGDQKPDIKLAPVAY